MYNTTSYSDGSNKSNINIKLTLTIGVQIFAWTFCAYGGEEQVLNMNKGLCIQETIENGSSINISFPNNNGIFPCIQAYPSNNKTSDGVESVHLNDEKVQGLKKIGIIEGLEDDWNGNGATSFSKHLIEKVKQIILNLNRQPEIFPTACDSIQLEYETDKKYLELEVDESDRCKIFSVDENGKEDTRYISSTPEEINKVVEMFYE
mgnify:CR=1 FL=1